MKRTVEIVLENLEFYAYHGFYEEERKTGNRFSVDIKVEVEIAQDTDFDDLKNTINYEELYLIVKEQMLSPAKLLEQVANNILSNILSRWQHLLAASVGISKFTPPIGGVCKKAMVTISHKR